MPSGVEVRKVNYDDKSSLVSALKGHDLFIITMGALAPAEMHTKLVEAAAEAEIPWVVPNEWGGKTNDDALNKDVIIGVGKKKEREYMEKLGLSWISFVCGFWYEFSLSGGTERYGFDLNKRSVTWFDDGNVRLDTSTFPQVARAVANFLALKILPEDENDKSPTISHWRNNFVHFSSFTVSQKDMFESVLRVTGTKASDWEQKTVDVKQWYADGVARLQKGDTTGFGQLLYGRMFFPDSPVDFDKQGIERDNEKLGLPKEDLDEFTKLAVEMAKDGYMEKQYAATFSNSK